MISLGRPTPDLTPTWGRPPPDFSSFCSDHSASQSVLTAAFYRNVWGKARATASTNHPAHAHHRPANSFRHFAASKRAKGSQGLCSQTFWRSVGSAGLCSFARSAMTRKRKDQEWRSARLIKMGWRWAYLLKPSPITGAGLMSFVADARATAVAKLRIKQFWAIPLTGRVVVPCPLMAMPLFLFLCEGVAKLTHGRRPRIASVGNTYRHEDVSRVAGRTH